MRTFPVLILLICFGFQNDLKGQLLRDIIKKTKSQVVDEISDALVEKAAEEISKKLMHQFNNYLDSIYYENYKQDSISGKYKTYPDFLADMDRSEEVPDQYHFDMTLDIETSHEKSKDSYQMLIAKDSSYFGILNDESLVIIDADPDLIVTYDLKENTAFAMGDMLRFAGGFVSSEINEDFAGIEIKKTGKTKMFLGYKCDQVVGESEDFEFDSYITQDFPADWKDMYGGLLQKFSNIDLQYLSSDLDGMVMYSYSVDEGEESTYEVINVDEKSTEITKSDFEFAKQYQD